MKDKKIVIIGGSSGIGAALKKMLQKSGMEPQKTLLQRPTSFFPISPPG